MQNVARRSSGSDQQRSEFLRTSGEFDSLGWVCIGVLSALIQAISSPTHCSWELPFAMGAGISVSVKALRKMSVQRVEKKNQVSFKICRSSSMLSTAERPVGWRILRPVPSRPVPAGAMTSHNPFEL
jgi:hypothetical protein